MPGDDVAQEWTRRLDEDGAVDFGRSWARVAVHVVVTLAFIGAGVAMIVSGDAGASTKVTGVFAVAVFSFFLFVLVVQVTAPGPLLRVDRRGMMVGYRKPLRIPWEQAMGVWVFKVNRMASAMVAVDTCDRTLDEYVRQASPWVRVLMRLGRIGRLRNTVTIGLLAAPADELASWLDAQVDVHAEVPSELILFPLEGSSPVWGGLSLRPVEVSRLRISHKLSEAITDWGRRAAPTTGRLLELGAGAVAPDSPRLHRVERECTLRIGVSAVSHSRRCHSPPLAGDPRRGAKASRPLAAGAGPERLSEQGRIKNGSPSGRATSVRTAIGRSR